MNLLTSENTFFINKDISLLYALLHCLQKFRRMRFHLWLSGSSVNPRELNTQSRTKWPGPWTLTHKPLRKLFWTFSTVGEFSQAFLAKLKGLLDSTQSCSSLLGINQHLPFSSAKFYCPKQNFVSNKFKFSHIHMRRRREEGCPGTTLCCSLSFALLPKQTRQAAGT